jgi:hypothetical protein
MATDTLTQQQRREILTARLDFEKCKTQPPETQNAAKANWDAVCTLATSAAKGLAEIFFIFRHSPKDGNAEKLCLGQYPFLKKF